MTIPRAGSQRVHCGARSLTRERCRECWRTCAVNAHEWEWRMGANSVISFSIVRETVRSRSPRTFTGIHDRSPYGPVRTVANGVRERLRTAMNVRERSPRTEANGSYRSRQFVRPFAPVRRERSRAFTTFARRSPYGPVRTVSNGARECSRTAMNVRERSWRTKANGLTIVLDSS